MNGNDIVQRLFSEITKNEKIFKAPSIYSEEDFESYLSSRIDAYYGFLKANDFSKFLNELYKYDLDIKSSKDELRLLNRIFAFSGVLKKGIKNYLNGKPNKFYESFSSSLDNLLNFKTNTFISEVSLETNYYRVRESKDSPLFEAKDLFHIPFELRHLCKTQRYSIPGVPSIYLGSSTEICFRELEINNSTKEQCYISLFQLGKSINVLEILTVQSFIDKMEVASSFSVSYNLLLKFVMLFPLYLACTIRVKTNSGFKPEYIVPQFLLEYVSSLDNGKKIDGIKFPSTKVNSPQAGHNIVLPIIRSDVSGYCSHLKSILRVSKPLVSGEFLNVRNSENIDKINFIDLDKKISSQDARLLV